MNKFIWIVIAMMSFCLLTATGCSKITATSGPGGSISPSGTFSVCNGKSQTFAITPDAGNTLADVQVDGVSTPTGTSITYTFTNVQTDHAIVVSFMTDTKHYDLFTIIYGDGGVGFSLCRVCHDPHNLTGLLNAYGRDVQTKRTAGYTKYQTFKLIEPLDSDGDGFSNGMEINVHKYPGEAGSHP